MALPLLRSWRTGLKITGLAAAQLRSAGGEPLPPPQRLAPSPRLGPGTAEGRLSPGGGFREAQRRREVSRPRPPLGSGSWLGHVFLPTRARSAALMGREELHGAERCAGRGPARCWSAQPGRCRLGPELLGSLAEAPPPPGSMCHSQPVASGLRWPGSVPAVAPADRGQSRVQHTEERAPALRPLSPLPRPGAGPR